MFPGWELIYAPQLVTAGGAKLFFLIELFQAVICHVKSCHSILNALEYFYAVLFKLCADLCMVRH